VGVLTDLIMATAEELGSADPDDVPINRLPGLDIKGTGLIELATLHAILGGPAFDPALADFPPVGGEPPEEGPWLVRCPDGLIRRLAGCPPAELRRAGAAWAETEELQLDGWTAEDATARLKEMAAFAARAIQQGKPVHLWTCL